MLFTCLRQNKAAFSLCFSTERRARGEESNFHITFCISTAFLILLCYLVCLDITDTIQKIFSDLLFGTKYNHYIMCSVSGILASVMDFLD